MMPRWPQCATSRIDKGAEAAVKKAIELGINELVIYYDYKA